MLKQHAHDSDQMIFTKSIPSIDLTVAGVAADATTVLFRPPAHTVFILTDLITENELVTGTVSDAPGIIVDNGTNGQDLVAAVDLATTQAAYKRHTMASTTLVLDHDNPLRLRSADGANGSTAFNVTFHITIRQLHPHK